MSADGEARHRGIPPAAIHDWVPYPHQSRGEGLPRVACLPACLPACLLACLLARSLACLLAWLRACVTACLLACELRVVTLDCITALLFSQLANRSLIGTNCSRLSSANPHEFFVQEICQICGQHSSFGWELDISDWTNSWSPAPPLIPPSSSHPYSVEYMERGHAHLLYQPPKRLTVVNALGYEAATA
jgi:hypothetical protein